MQKPSSPQEAKLPSPLATTATSCTNKKGKESDAWHKKSLANSNVPNAERPMAPKEV